MDPSMIEISLRDSSFAHCVYSNNPLPPKTFSKEITWNRKSIKPGETVFTDFHVSEGEGNIVWLLEPYDLQPHVYEQVKRNASKYKEIWTTERSLLELPNAKFIPFG